MSENANKGAEMETIIECDCGAHRTGNRARVSIEVAERLAAMTPKQRSERVHGFVNLAHHPALSKAPQVRRNGPWAA